jgi:hypothetical protein
VRGAISTNSLFVYGPSTLLVQGVSQFGGQISSPSLLTSSIYCQQPPIVKSTIQPFIQYGISTFQASQFPIVLPVHYANRDYAIQITGSEGNNQTIIPHASTISVSSFYVHGTTQQTFSWTTFGQI